MKFIMKLQRYFKILIWCRRSKYKKLNVYWFKSTHSANHGYINYCYKLNSVYIIICSINTERIEINALNVKNSSNTLHFCIWTNYVVLFYQWVSLISSVSLCWAIMAITKDSLEVYYVLLRTIVKIE